MSKIKPLSGIKAPENRQRYHGPSFAYMMNCHDDGDSTIFIFILFDAVESHQIIFDFFLSKLEGPRRSSCHDLRIDFILWEEWSIYICRLCALERFSLYLSPHSARTKTLAPASGVPTCHLGDNWKLHVQAESGK